MCDPNLLCSIKEVLNFLLNSNNRVYNTIYTLDDEFFDFVGCRIPYYDLGYSFLETFLQSIPDVLWVKPFSKQVYSSNCRNQTQSNNVLVPAHCGTSVPSNVFQVLPWNPGMINWSKCGTPWKKPHKNFNYFTSGNIKHEFRPQSSNNSRQLRSSTVASSSKVHDKTANQNQKNITMLEGHAKAENQILSRSKIGDGESVDVSVDVATNSTSVIKSRQVTVFSKCKNVTPTSSYIYSGDYIDNGSRVDTKLNENEGEKMQCFDLKDIVNAFPVSDRNTPFSDYKAPIFNPPNTYEFGPPAYSETDMINFAGAASYFNDNVGTWPQKYLYSGSDDHELIKESVELVNEGFDSSDEDEVPRKPNPNPNTAISYNQGHGPIPFIVDDDPILMIGSKFSNKRYGVNIATVNIETKMKVKGFYELNISEVSSPYKFWFQLIEDNNCELYELKKQLNAFYNTSLINSEDHIDEIFMAKGYPCAAFYSEQWHRAEFICKTKDKQVKLFFVDYGTVAKVSISDIRKLLNTFCKLPRLCFRGSLDFIRPTDDRWNIEATTYFCDLIRDVKLVAGVSEINKKENSARIYAIDQSNNTIVNCKLVENGYAFPEDPRDRWENQSADKLPTFKSLEKGEYPSRSLEMDEYLYAEKMFETTVTDGVDCYTPQFMSDEEAAKTIRKFFEQKQIAKEIASKRDNTMFMILFKRILNNPFLNGMPFQVHEMRNVSSPNPFLSDSEDSIEIFQ